ncbi:hypothetical protein LRS03_14755 [Rhizobacter sp. J219]|jgi:hypothetical protein|uniref:hypothetical protein n=1 Tax=Rhizobacter sp. J219 TaxID=2898430 RepID=UPI002151D971|nr:hypothetical protein [Rhizobacter sp. J219]MCR5884044.1 hypothetical protein [Rhizobacter sp. J219]
MHSPRSHHHRCVLGALALVALAAWPAAQAQSLHRCSDNGKAYYSDKPCPANGATRITAYGPPPTRDAYSGSSSTRLQKAPDHLSFMSPECASLSEAIRTARTRGVGYDTQQDLRDEFRRKCGEEEREARRQLHETEKQRRIEARDQRVAQQQERVQATMTLEQCREMGRIVAERKKRFDSMTPGERGDFERFQTNFGERCRGL